MIKLWSINKIIRWTGFRLMIIMGDSTKIGLKWCGLPGSKKWAEWEPHNPTPMRSLLRGDKK